LSGFALKRLKFFLPNELAKVIGKTPSTTAPEDVWKLEEPLNLVIYIENRKHVSSTDGRPIVDRIISEYQTQYGSPWRDSSPPAKEGWDQRELLWYYKPDEGPSFYQRLLAKDCPDFKTTLTFADLSLALPEYCQEYVYAKFEQSREVISPAGLEDNRGRFTIFIA
jgi:hypothetical protein